MSIRNKIKRRSFIRTTAAGIGLGLINSSFAAGPVNAQQSRRVGIIGLDTSTAQPSRKHLMILLPALNFSDTG
jgi:hypothetical protein